MTLKKISLSLACLLGCLVFLSGCSELMMPGPAPARYTQVPVIKAPKPRPYHRGKKSSLNDIVNELEKASLLVKSLDDESINTQLLSEDIDRIILDIKRSKFYNDLNRTKRRQKELLRRELDDSIVDNALTVFGE